jgi:C1A family cysteine protease
MEFYRMGWKRDLPDHRDYKYSTHKEMAKVVALPEKADLRAKMSPIEDQGDMGSCVAHSVVGALEFLELGAISNHSTSPEKFAETFVDLSRMFVYANARIIDGDLDSDNGTHIRVAILALRKWGICREVLWPYQDRLCFTHPSLQAYKEGDQHLIPTGYRIDHTNLIQIKTALATGFPVCFGMSVYDSFMGSQARKTGIITFPRADESFQGGHAMLIVGYDDAHNWFIVRNSWSAAWGDHGHCYIPYSYLTHPQLAADFWTLRA